MQETQAYQRKEKENKDPVSHLLDEILNLSRSDDRSKPGFRRLVKRRRGKGLELKLIVKRKLNVIKNNNSDLIEKLKDTDLEVLLNNELVKGLSESELKRDKNVLIEMLLYLGVSSQCLKKTKKEDIINEPPDTRDILKMISILIAKGVLASVVILAFYFALQNISSEVSFFQQLSHTVSSGEFVPSHSELTSKGIAYIYVHPKFTATNEKTVKAGIAEREDYKRFLEDSDEKIQEILDSGNPVVFVVSRDTYNSIDYPQRDNVAYVISGAINGRMSPVVVDGALSYDQDYRDIEDLLLRAGVKDLYFGGEYAGNCISQAQTAFSDIKFNHHLDADLMYKAPLILYLP